MRLRLNITYSRGSARRTCRLFGVHYRENMKNLATEESDFDRLKRKEQEWREILKTSGRALRSADNLPREALYDRDGGMRATKRFT